jgi:hypothetical protein
VKFKLKMENFSTIANCQAASEKIKVFKKYIAAVERRRASTFREVRALVPFNEHLITGYNVCDKRESPHEWECFQTQYVRLY